MKIAIVGATGEVGNMMLNCLNDFNIDYTELKLFASQKSEGKIINFNNKSYMINALDKNSLKEKFDYILFSAGSSIAKEYAKTGAEAGAVVIDNSSAFRQNREIPLVVPEVNGFLLEGYNGIISNPNCSTIQMIHILDIFEKLYKLEKVVVTTFQSVSGAGHKGIQTLLNQRVGICENGPFTKKIDLNVIPQIGEFYENGYCEEELKMCNESRKILNLPELKITATTVRVPVIFGHSESIYIETVNTVDLQELYNVFKKNKTVFIDNPYITPLEIGNSNLSHISRLRYANDKRSVNLWNVAHNVRLGAAANAVKILAFHKLVNN